ncbi:phospholipid carrier-dependent glycosyltransferase [Agromyces sp. ISL-38]|uniref:dolichyl-phosphate-mannose--protein mannosyltransferase n=1 Tax=Agromyces sp. ISL-38 TaxID=2819107 RepID=UPI001BEC7AFE|nr:phospholipid carrier-dependent glycosyltransferase [Agromyces sp. ISL-38]MBT2498772.1 phospholipid carrier-dependent glycosyltransferase [Agromyces sp. ISL-38]
MGVEPADDDPYREPRGTRLDAWWARMLSTPGRRALWYWGGPVLVTLIAAVLRFWNLGHPQAIVFDETYYVKDAWTLLQNGYESSWPEGSDADFANGDTSIFSDDPTYVVHPPLGKWMISLGMAAFGAGDAFWWRATTALAGTIAVFLLAVVARRLFSSTVLAVIAGLLFAVDGNAIVMSRVALLDNWLMLFTLLGFWFVLLDRAQARRLLESRLDRARESGADPAYGPALWARPWLLAAALALGAACAVKWSGVYFVAAFGVYLVVVDALARRRAGVPFWLTAAVLKQAPITFVILVPVAAAVYLASWTGWLVTDGGYYRHWAEEAGHAATGLFSWVPLTLQSLWHYHEAAYGYHVGVHQAHPWQANPLTWLLMIRPTNMYFASTDDGSGGCGADTCWESVMGIGNPLIWWAAAAASVYLVYRLARYREWQAGAILLGLAAGYLPWLMYLNRTVFQFYSIVFEPYTVLALVFVVGLVLGRPEDPRWRRQRGLAVVGIFLGFVVLVSAFFLPLWTGMPVTPEFRQLHFWLPTWG